MKKVFILIFTFLFILPAFSFAAFSDMETLNIWRARGGFLYEVRRGSTGFEVKTVQTFLASVFPEQNIKADGIFGPKTESFLKLFEYQNNLPQIGKVSAETKNLLTEKLKKELCPTSEFEESYIDFPIGRSEKLPEGYSPKNLIVLPPYISTKGIICVSEETYEPLIEMLEDAKVSGANIIVTSGFRRFEMQDYLKNLYLRTEGPNALRGVAEPGHSEHQIGTALDFSSSTLGGVLSEKFIETKEGAWLSENAYKYGFVMSFPYGKEEITGYKYEPWHYRYVGEDLAEEIKEEGVTTIEYLQKIEKDDSE